MRQTRAKAALFGLWALLGAAGAQAGEVFRFPAPGPQGQGLPAAREVVVYSVTDIEAAEPVVAGFQRRHPELAVAYHEMQSMELNERLITESDGAGETADVAFSSAMDLQMKLVNDGYALRRRSPEAAGLPAWAVWRDEAYGVTFEPVVFAYHKPFFGERPPPRTRAELMALLARQEEAVFGRVATYDVERSGLGFLFLARDVEHYDDIWDLYRLLGENGVKLYSQSAAIIDRIAKGDFVLGYNLLGSYAAARAERDPDLGIVLPDDYVVAMSRIVLIPKAARAPELGARFLDYLLSEEGQRILSERSRLNAVNEAVTGPNTVSTLVADLGARLQPIAVGPGLLAYLDQVKRRRLVRRWNRALGGG